MTMFRQHSIKMRFMVALLLTVVGMLALSDSADAYRRRFIGGYGLVITDHPTFAYFNYYSPITGEVKEGDIVFIKGWDTNLYNIGTNKWVDQDVVLPIIDWEGDPMVSEVTRRGGQYYLEGEQIQLPARYVTEAEKFLANPDIDAPIVFEGSEVPIDLSAELVDTSAVWYGRAEPVVAALQVSSAYDAIYMYEEPADDAVKVDELAYAGKILTAYEIKDDRWYRVHDNLWIASERYGEVLLELEDVESYAEEEYHNDEKWISIDLDSQYLTAWEGDEVVMGTSVKSGKYGYDTPPGVWRTYEKVANEHMAGVDYDYLDVAWTQYFTPNRAAIHSAYWHNDYNGRPGSHGCVNVRPEVGKDLFMWAPLGITVVTHNPYQHDAFDIEFASRELED
jgi:hypothetical protein